MCNHILNAYMRGRRIKGIFSWASLMWMYLLRLASVLLYPNRYAEHYGMTSIIYNTEYR